MATSPLARTKPSIWPPLTSIFVPFQSWRGSDSCWQYEGIRKARTWCPSAVELIAVGLPVRSKSKPSAARSPRRGSMPRELSKEGFSIITTPTCWMGMRGSGVPAGRCGSGSESGRRITSASDAGRGEAPRGRAATAALAATPVRNDRRLRWKLTILEFAAADHRSCHHPRHFGGGATKTRRAKPRKVVARPPKWGWGVGRLVAGRLLQELGELSRVGLGVVAVAVVEQDMRLLRLRRELAQLRRP